MQDQQDFNQNSKNLELSEAALFADELSFKPITKGLGFNKKKTREVSFRKTEEKRVVVKKEEAPQLFMENIQTSNALSSSAPANQMLENTYGTEKEVRLYQPKLRNVRDPQIRLEDLGKSLSSATQEPVHPGVDIAAWLIDLVTITAGFSLFGAGLYALEPAIFMSVIKGIQLEEVLFLLGLYLCYYFSYFLALERMGTLGKSLLGTKLKSTNSDHVSFQQIFTRSFVMLISFTLFLMPMFLDFQGKLSDTAHVKNEF